MFKYSTNFSNFGIGIDDLFQTLETKFNNINTSTFPPHNIQKLSDNEYLLELALAGYDKSDIEIVFDRYNRQLDISSNKEKDDKKTYVHKGIANRNFKQSFILAEDMTVGEVIMENGMLRLKLIKQIPEDKKPIKVEIK